MAESKPKLYRKKPIVVDAIQFDGSKESGDAVVTWAAVYGGKLWYNGFDKMLRVGTLEGQILASPGDWVICGLAHEFYPCKPDIFEATYDEVGQSITHTLTEDD